jgi:hypothetical protein
VNPGLLHGPFLPIYGLFCLIVIAVEKPLVNISSAISHKKLHRPPSH